MPILTLSWQMDLYFPVDEQLSAQMNWVNVIKWRKANGTLLSASTGLYVIEDAAGGPVYAGQAESMQGRFNGRSDALRSLNVRAGALGGLRLRRTGVTSNRYADPTRIGLAERWLVRALFRREGANHQLQNITLLNAFEAPNDGLTIIFLTAAAPGYVKNSPGYGNFAAPYADYSGYIYEPNEMVLPGP
jgi:hypothetical protein